MEHKNIVATIYIKNGKAVKSPDDLSDPRDVMQLANGYNDSGVDKIFLIDLSDDEAEHMTNMMETLSSNLKILICSCL